MRGPGARVPSLSRRSKILISIALVVVLLLILGPRFVGIYTDSLWFSALGYGKVFSTIIYTRIVLFLIFGIVAGAVIFGAMFMAYRTRPMFAPSAPGDPVARYRAVVLLRARWFAIVPPVFAGIIAGSVAQANWAQAQLFLHGGDFGIKDPQFHLDVGFYVFDLPMYRYVLGFLFVIVVVAFLINLVAHYIFGGLVLGQRTQSLLSQAARIQLAALAGTFLLLKAVAYWFDQYALLSTTRSGANFTGASYTDINAVLPAKLILLAIATICAAAFFGGIILRDLRIPVVATVLMVLSALIIGWAWPTILQQFSVNPNKSEKEAQYIGRNIEATREAYKLTNVDYDRQWGTAQQPTPLANADEATLSNIRLLDPSYLQPVFEQLHQNNNFYSFPQQLALDRYNVDGQLRDYVVTVREMDPASLTENQRNWLNRHTVYTHGQGFLVAPANQVDSSGAPIISEFDISNKGHSNNPTAPDITVKQPRIYFGEVIAKSDPDYAIVGKSKEFDTAATTFTYDGDGGVKLDNIFRRAAYAIKFGEKNFLFSNAVDKNTQILYDRDPRDRVKKAAPWLTVDSKAYPAVMDDGSIQWIVDGYTTASGFPYAQNTSLSDATTDAQVRQQGDTGRTQVNRQVSYVRNSVKATVDAYTGKVTLYQFDTEDPVLKAWMKVFPGTVQPRSELNKHTDLMQHIRYPEDLFKIQRELLGRYHVSDPSTFFRSEEFWDVPNDPTNEGLDQPPYYYVAADPRTGNPSFQLTSPMNAWQKQYLASFMTVSSDPANYGQISVKQLANSDASQVQGPSQALSLMRGEPAFSALVKTAENTLDLQYGNLLTLPLQKNGLLDVVPIYSAAKNTNAPIPQLYQVLVLYKDVSTAQAGKIAFGESLPEAIAKLAVPGVSVANMPDVPQVPTSTTPTPTNTNTPPSSTTPATPATPGGQLSPQLQSAIDRITAALKKMDDAKKAGNFEQYGLAIQELEQATADYNKAPK